MHIVQEQISRSGILCVNTLNDVKRVYKANGQNLRGFEGPQIVIWAKLATGSYPIVFPCERTRDAAYDVIQDQDNVVLDYHKYFTTEVIKQDRANELVKIRLSNHLRICITKIMERDNIDYPQLLERDAFKECKMSIILKLMQGSHKIELNPTDKQVSLWAKTLHTPEDFIRLGITPLQFYKAITNNERTYYSGSTRILM